MRPTFNVETVVCVSRARALSGRAREAAEDDRPRGEDDLRDIGLSADDAVVGVTASGRTPYVRGAIAYARSVGALTVGLSANAGSALSSEVDLPIEVLTGPEILLGSTRLKAGTAQKMVLNMLSTLSMVRTGRTFGNLMIDVRADNEKLRVRAAKMVALAAGVSGRIAPPRCWPTAGSRPAPRSWRSPQGLSPEEAGRVSPRPAATCARWSAS